MSPLKPYESLKVIKYYFANTVVQMSNRVMLMLHDILFTHTRHKLSRVSFVHKIEW